jgi:hypothetical protein
LDGLKGDDPFDFAASLELDEEVAVFGSDGDGEGIVEEDESGVGFEVEGAVGGL